MNQVIKTITSSLLCCALLSAPLSFAASIPLVDDIIDGANEGARTLKGTTTVGGKVEIEVEAGDITQVIEGDNNINELNLGAVSGGSFIDGDFDSDVDVGDVTQKIHGDNNFNRANIGAVTN
ncbi:MAG: hypothetical protein KTR17_11470 [Cellvibrionaceae bacterium]|nr:hypothetical protein [Cellvibrionaceae bacterium]